MVLLSLSQLEQPQTDAYEEYLHKPNRFMNEHEYFMCAKAELQKHHHEKVTKVSDSCIGSSAEFVIDSVICYTQMLIMDV